TYNPDGSHSGSTSNTISAIVNNGASPPTVSITAPAPAATVSGIIAMTAAACDKIPFANVQFALDSANLGTAATNAPYSLTLNTYTLSNGSHTLSAVAVNASSLSASASITFTVNNPAVTASYSIPASGAALLTTTSDAG